GIYQYDQDQALHAHSVDEPTRAQTGRTSMSLVRGDMELRYWERVPTGREETDPGTARRALIMAVALAAGLLNGCGATRPSKYYQLTVPADAGAVEKPDAVPVPLLLGVVKTLTLYHKAHI